VCRKSSDKGHKRTNSDGTIKFTTSSYQDLTALDTSTATMTTTTTTASPKRHSLLVTAADNESLSNVDSNKPEVGTTLMITHCLVLAYVIESLRFYCCAYTRRP